MPNSMLFNKEEDIIKMVRMTLGEPTINVELTDQQIYAQLQEQILLLSKKQFFVDYYRTFVSKGDKKIKVIDRDNRRITGIHQLVVQDDRLSIYNMQQFQQLIAGSMQTILEQLTYIDSFKNILLTPKEWKWNETTNELIFLSPIYQDQWAVVTYFYIPNLRDIPENKIMWVYRYTLQKSKEILGRIRAKLEGVQTQVGVIQLAGSELLNEQNTEIQNLLDELDNIKSKHISPFYLI